MLLDIGLQLAFGTAIVLAATVPNKPWLLGTYRPCPCYEPANMFVLRAVLCWDMWFVMLVLSCTADAVVGTALAATCFIHVAAHQNVGAPGLVSRSTLSLVLTSKKYEKPNFSFFLT